MNTIIEKIRAEVNRQAKSIDTATGDFAEGRRMEQRIILSVLSDLEKSEKPSEGLEEEIKTFTSRFCVDRGSVQIVEEIACHFYELGRQSGCVKVKAESSIDKFILENCTHCTIEHCPGMRECYTSFNKQLQ